MALLAHVRHSRHRNSLPVDRYLLALLPHPTPDPKDFALQTFLVFPRPRTLPTVWRDRLKQYPAERHLTLKELTTIAWYLGAPGKQGTSTPCGIEGCPVCILVNIDLHKSGRDGAHGKRRPRPRRSHLDVGIRDG
ncbi:uncharacterized protein B0T23DRAFT_383026 [Neurospora hispaniola]|uniref:Uncharacterized protein n=1 Tax=Neurospora hispaniola TaxID=588809 RepID=A0AAJ0I6H2_9PEZI|nr:hypothetical protein B0T23DRAFT_383026 [Neurospora hispaniola]